VSAVFPAISASALMHQCVYPTVVAMLTCPMMLLRASADAPAIASCVAK
jgi:hypothetical protein